MILPQQDRPTLTGITLRPVRHGRNTARLRTGRYVKCCPGPGRCRRPGPLTDDTAPIRRSADDRVLQNSLQGWTNQPPKEPSNTIAQRMRNMVPSSPAFTKASSTCWTSYSRPASPWPWPPPKWKTRQYGSRDASELTELHHRMRSIRQRGTGRQGRGDRRTAASLALRGVDVSTRMVGDRSHDVAGAAYHGIPTIFVPWGYGDAEETAGAAAVAETPRPCCPCSWTPAVSRAASLVR